MRDQYPKYIGGADSFFSDEVARQGGSLGYIENGPVARHNDWPYSVEKIAEYEALAGRRAAIDLYYLRWKARDLWRRICG